MTERPCGGCDGLGAHWRWCRTAYGAKANFLGTWSVNAGNLADTIGSNCPGAANHMYQAAALLEQEAYDARTEYLEALEEQGD